MIFTGYGHSQYVKASESERTTSKSNRISKEDERLIDQFLDETMGIDPARIAIEKDPAYTVKPTSASGFSLNTGYGVEKNILNSSWLNLNSRKYYATADFFLFKEKGPDQQSEFLCFFRQFPLY